jgi:catechol 2,3-dioxygenase-like lactoylglutathione lyase family enzyme
MEIKRLDHLVLTVRDVQKTLNFYTHVLGMREVTFGDGRKALVFGNQKLNIHEYRNELEPKALRPTPGSADLCFISAVSIARVIERLSAEGIAIIEGPVTRTGAIGKLVSVYFRDPDANLIEISEYEKEEA